MKINLNNITRRITIYSDLYKSTNTSNKVHALCPIRFRAHVWVEINEFDNRYLKRHLILEAIRGSYEN